ncbi:ORF6C domain-containing protein [Streptococcus suis]|uniref:ORF6C domain-containing protein n=2 Tax=Streptococcus suis TaxID=1307 RepID=UPI000CF4ED0E|nr:ORF6C domain-containing protein [Streptococcus suis]MBY5027538.1 ORF6C domain-containing protein [Streptococcus suis]
MTNEIIGRSKDHGKQIAEIAVMRRMLDSIENHEERITNLEDTMRVNAVQETVLTDEVNKVVLAFLDGKQAPAYKDRSIRGRAYSAINKDIRKRFGVRRKEIPAKEYQEAVVFIRQWQPDFELKSEISAVNAG